jgi:hypothetical protein
MRQGEGVSRRLRGRGLSAAVLLLVAAVFLLGWGASVEGPDLPGADRALTLVGGFAYAIPLLRTHATLGRELFGPEWNYRVTSQLFSLARVLAAYRGSCGTYPSSVDAPTVAPGAPAACTAGLGDAVAEAWRLARRVGYSFEWRYEPKDPTPGAVPPAWGDYAVSATWAGQESHLRLRLQGTRSFRMEASGVRSRWAGLGDAQPDDALHHPFPAPDPLAEARDWAEHERRHPAHPR